MSHTYPANFEEKTGFDRIREMLLAFCQSPLGEKEVRRIRFDTAHGRIGCLLQQAEEFRQIILAGEAFPGANYYDPSEVFAHLAPAGTFAEPEVLLDLKLSLEAIISVMAFLARTREDGSLKYPWLARHTGDLEIDTSLPAKINALIDEHGMVRSSASPALAEIRKTKQDLEKKALQRINNILNDGKGTGVDQKGRGACTQERPPGDPGGSRLQAEGARLHPRPFLYRANGLPGA